MTVEPILSVRNIGKRFDLRESTWEFAREWLHLDKQEHRPELWAVRNVSFEIRPGQVVGLIGANGAGKSTLVKMLTGALDPSEGTYSMKGRLFSLPELGTDLNEDLSGRENVVVGAQLLGLPDGYAEARMEAIKEFSELGEFFDRHVRTYSTGMRMRLAFSTFAFLESDLLILDEVMAVGDVFFQQRCFERLAELIRAGTSILLVTHDLNAILHYCNEVLVLHQGALAFRGRAADAIQAFVRLRGSRTARDAETAFTPGNDWATVPEEFHWPDDESIFQPPGGPPPNGSNGRLTRLAICNSSGEPATVFRQGDTAVIYYEFEITKNIGVPVGLLEIHNPYNILIHSKSSLQHRAEAPTRVEIGQQIRFCQRVEVGLEPLDYVITLGLLTLHPDDAERVDELTQQDFNERLIWVTRQPQAAAINVTFGFGRGMALSHAGLCDLPGDCHMSVVPQGNSAEPRQPVLTSAETPK